MDQGEGSNLLAACDFPRILGAHGRTTQAEGIVPTRAFASALRIAVGTLSDKHKCRALLASRLWCREDSLDLHSTRIDSLDSGQTREPFVGFVLVAHEPELGSVRGRRHHEGKGKNERLGGRHGQRLVVNFGVVLLLIARVNQ